MLHLNRNIFLSNSDIKYLWCNEHQTVDDTNIAHRPGGVVILGSHLSNWPSQYAWAWGIWKGSSYKPCKQVWQTVQLSDHAPCMARTRACWLLLGWLCIARRTLDTSSTFLYRCGRLKRDASRGKGKLAWRRNPNLSLIYDVQVNLRPCCTFHSLDHHDAVANNINHVVWTPAQDPFRAFLWVYRPHHSRSSRPLLCSDHLAGRPHFREPVLGGQLQRTYHRGFVHHPGTSEIPLRPHPFCGMNTWMTMGCVIRQFVASLLFCVKRRVAVRLKLQRISKTYKPLGGDDLPKVRSPRLHHVRGLNEHPCSLPSRVSMWL